LVLLGVMMTAGLFWVGRDYYTLPHAMRAESDLHKMLKPSGLWGHGVGVGATVFMLLNFVYPIRKRLRIFKGKASIAPWLTFHVFVGTMSPIIILFHAAFQWGNMLATMTYVSVVIVAITGLIGRYIFGLVPTRAPTEMLKSLEAAVKSVQNRLDPLKKGDAQNRLRALDALLAHAKAPPATRQGSVVGLLFRLPFSRMRMRRHLRRVRAHFLDEGSYREFSRVFREALALKTQVDFYRGLKRMMNGWRVFHVVLAVFLLVVISAHVWVSITVGMRWIF
jgi:hypothetical protein